MEKEKIERAAIRMLPYSDEECADSNYVLGKNVGFKRGFTAGARWRINEAWHDEKEMPDKEELVFCEICRNGEKAYLPLQWEADGKMTVDIPFLGDCKVTRWAYLDDLLPDERKEAEP